MNLMLGQKKVFDADLKRNNESGVLKAVSFLKQLDFEEKKDSYTEAYKKWDVVLYKSNRKYTFEIEVKQWWNNRGKWGNSYSNCDYCQVAHRKIHSKADFFIMLNKHLDTLLLTKMSFVKSSKAIHVPNKYCDNEFFFRFPVSSSNVIFAHFKYGQWIRTKHNGMFSTANFLL